MAQLQDFSPEQMKEAHEWYIKNAPQLMELNESWMPYLADVYFKLKRTTTPLKPNQFVIGVDYTGATDEEYRKKGVQMDFSKFNVNLSFWNPHPKGVADTLAKDFLLSKISTLQ